MVVILHTTHVLATVTIDDGDGGLYKEDELEDSVDGCCCYIKLVLRVRRFWALAEPDPTRTFTDWLTCQAAVAAAPGRTNEPRNNPTCLAAAAAIKLLYESSYIDIHAPFPGSFIPLANATRVEMDRIFQILITINLSNTIDGDH